MFSERNLNIHDLTILAKQISQFLLGDLVREIHDKKAFVINKRVCLLFIVLFSFLFFFDLFISFLCVRRWCLHKSLEMIIP